MPDNKKQIDLENLSVFKEEMDSSVDEKVSAKQDKLPETTSADEGKVLTVDNNGNLVFDEAEAGLNASQFFEKFDATKTYEIGDAVSYDGKFYLCKTAISTAGAWDSTKWVETKPVMQLLEVSNVDGTILSDEDYCLVKSNVCILKRQGYQDVFYKSRTYEDTTRAAESYSSFTINGGSGANGYIQAKELKINTSKRVYYSYCNALEPVVNEALAGTEPELTSFRMGYSNKYSVGKSISYLTTAPSADNTSGRLEFVVLDAEPATYYNGYYYIITGSN